MESESPLPVWRPRPPETNALLAFSTRLGGASAAPFDTLNLGTSTGDLPEAVAENRRRFLSVLGLDSGRLATAGQVHGAAAVQVLRAGFHPRCDVLATRVRGIALAVTTADCLPLLLTAPGAVAAAHCGWRGTAAGAPRAAVEAVCAAAGVPASTVTVHLGPCIRPCCYRVGQEVAGQFPERAVVLARGFTHLDLPSAARMQLLEAGVSGDRIHEVPACTACEPARYFSHRRDGERTGRHWAVAVLHP